MVLKTTMYPFDANKIWYSAEKRSYMILSSSDIQLLAERVNLKHGGILKKGQMILLSSAFKCLYDLIIIKSHPCVLIKKLGSGAYGIVYEAYDLKLHKKVAVKSQPGHLADVINKQAEITKMNGIGLADIGVNIGPSYLADGNGYFILPLADTNFENWVIQKVIAGQENLIVKALIKIAQDLQSLHSQRKVHMDLKPDNVLVIDNEAFISDFGKVEKDGAIVPSVMEPHIVRVKTVDKVKYPQLAPEYFFCNSKNPLFTVCYTFDLYSYGNLMKMTSNLMRDKKYKGEIAAIATYTHKVKISDRKELKDVIIYLQKID